MDVMLPVSISDIEAPVSRMEGNVSRDELLPFLVHATLPWCACRPNDLTTESGLGHAMPAPNACEVKELLVAFLANVNSVPGPAVLVSEAADKFTIAIEDHDRV